MEEIISAQVLLITKIIDQDLPCRPPLREHFVIVLKVLITVITSVKWRVQTRLLLTYVLFLQIVSVLNFLFSSHLLFLVRLIFLLLIV